MTAYITKYALTKGIIEVEATPCKSPTMIKYQLPGYTETYAHTNEWFGTLGAALAHAEVMRLKAITALNKKLRKLEKINFNA